MSRTVRIDLGARRDPILLGAGIIGERGPAAPHAGGRQAFVVTGETARRPGMNTAPHEAAPGGPTHREAA